MRRVGLAADVAAVLVFVGIGRSVHTDGLTLGGMASTAWPFLVGLAVGWLLVTACRLDPVAPSAGAVVVLVTVGVGMVLRVVSGQGTAVAFVLVALAFLGAATVGWRLVALVATRWRRARSPST